MATERQPAKAEWTAPKVITTAKATPDLVTVPARLALAIDGAGAPASDAFTESVGALYGIAYTLKFSRKKSGKGTPFKIAPLEGRWSAEDWPDPDHLPPIEKWRWRLRICVPDDVSPVEVAQTIREATSKKKGKLEGSSLAAQVFLEKIPRQRCGRILHVGPYADEARSFVVLKELLNSAGLKAAHRHIEIYISDPRRVAPTKLKTVLLKEVS